MVSILSVLVACSAERAQPGTGASIVVADDGAVYTANPWDGTVSRMDAAGKRTGEAAVGGEPTRMVRVGDELWVTLRSERSVAVLDLPASGAPREKARFTVGAEPYGLAVSSDGSRVYVAVSQQDRVVEIDAASKTEIRSFDVMDDPRWLALHPCDCALFVASAYDAPLARIDLESGEITRISPPGTWVPGDDGSTTDLTPRNTGDLAISPLGDAIVWPVFYVDNESAGDQPAVNAADITPPVVPYYTGPTTGVGLQLSVSKFNAALVGVSLDLQNGQPVEGEDSIAVFVGGFADNLPKRGYVSSAVFDPNGTTVYAALESADAVAAIDLRPVDGQRMDLSVLGEADTTFGFVDTAATRVAPSAGNFYERSQGLVSVSGNPSGFAIGPDGEVLVHEKGGRNVSRVNPRALGRYLDELSTGSAVLQSFSATRRDAAATVRTSEAFEAGRRMFYSANDARMAALGAGVSCSTCHFDGRNDGLTWTFDHNPRQTPSLAGNVGETTPVTWTQGVETVAQEARITTLGRMGGGGLSDPEALALETFVNAIRPVDVDRKGVRDDLVARGEALFTSASVGCSECHAGPRQTDNQRHRMFGLTVDTPTLTGIDATGPYLHDGSAKTLRQVLERSRDGSMGDTSGLSDADLDAMVAYLRTL